MSSNFRRPNLPFEPKPPKCRISSEFRVGLVIKPGEPLDHLLRRFKRDCDKGNILPDWKKHSHYEKPSISSRRKSAMARARAEKLARKSEV
jgi:small subunit ribosomal protein S21